tara:strand:- start:49 stop:372 length:324 start_codon:yes stop_codon:yes gene_type:complete
LTYESDFTPTTKRLLQKLVVESWDAEATANLYAAVRAGTTSLTFDRALFVLNGLVGEAGHYTQKTWSGSVVALVGFVPLSKVSTHTLDALKLDDPKWAHKLYHYPHA